MPPEDDIRIKLAQDIGYIKGTVRGLDDKVDGLTRKMEHIEGSMNSRISAIHQSVAGLVRREDCEEHMETIREEVGGAISAASRAHEAASLVKAEVTGKFAIPPEVRNASPAESPSLWGRIVDHSRGITSVLIVLGMIGAAIIAFSHFVTRIEQSLAVADEMQKRTQESITKRLATPSRVVYVKPTVDAGNYLPVDYPEPRRTSSKKR